MMRGKKSVQSSAAWAKNEAGIGSAASAALREGSGWWRYALATGPWVTLTSPSGGEWARLLLKGPRPPPSPRVPFPSRRLRHHDPLHTAPRAHGPQLEYTHTHAYSVYPSLSSPLARDLLPPPLPAACRLAVVFVQPATSFVLANATLSFDATAPLPPSKSHPSHPSVSHSTAATATVLIPHGRPVPALPSYLSPPPLYPDSLALPVIHRDRLTESTATSPTLTTTTTTTTSTTTLPHLPYFFSMYPSPVISLIQ